jgi:CTP synthase (UTP-ammonia lyase)
MASITIGIIGDFNPSYSVHVCTNDGIQDAATALGARVEAAWLPTDARHDYARYPGLLCAPGSPYKSFDGALAGIRYAREHGIPLLGTCGGFQHLVIEYARNVMGFSGASHAETDPDGPCLFVTPLSCSLVGKTMEVSIAAGSRAARVFGAERSMEAFYCNFGLNPIYQGALQSAGLNITGIDQNGEARIVELPDHPFFFGTLFVPQARSRPGTPHPLVAGLCRAAIDRATGLNAA